MNDESEFDKLPPAEQIARLSRFTYWMKPQAIAKALVQQAGDADLARDQLQELRKLLADAEIYLTAE